MSVLFYQLCLTNFVYQLSFTDTKKINWVFFLILLFLPQIFWKAGDTTRSVFCLLVSDHCLRLNLIASSTLRHVDVLEKTDGVNS